MARTRVTVVTPSYNQGPFIRATIESVLSQDYPNLEYIIMDGGSTDETRVVVKDYASRLTWISEKDRGQSHAINKGFQMAEGEIVSWLNSDDVLLPGAITRAVAELDAHPEFGAVYGEGYLIDRWGEVKKRFPVTEPFNLWKLTYLSDYILQQTVFFRRSVVEDVGWLDEDLHYAMDWDLLIRIGKRFELGFVPEDLGCLREYPEAKSFSGGRRRITEIARILRHHTGQRIPPGLIVYGLDCYRAIWSEAIRSWEFFPLRWVFHWLHWVVNMTCLNIIGHQVLRAQGLYRTGWAGYHVRLMAPSSAASMRLEGYAPPVGRRRLLEAVVDDGEPVCCDVSNGYFSFEIPLAESDDPHHIHLRMKHFGWVPRDHHGRPHCLRLDSIRFDPRKDFAELSLRSNRTIEGCAIPI